MFFRPQLAFGLSLALLAGCGRQTPEKGDGLPEKVTFNAHIRPIFSDTCFSCHGFEPKTRKEDLRLDTPEGAYAKLKDSEIHAIVPGKPDKSAILARMLSDDPEEVMPPPDFHKTLTDRQKALVRKWIEQGAEYEDHWSFTPIKRPPLPKLAKHEDQAENPIDRFILARLEAEGVKPAPIADKPALLRRLSLDLTGLPP
jgi:mono/diheme cytochrome c family protein